VPKAKFNIGVFAGIINKTSGKLLLRRRTEEGSILPDKSFTGNWELPGGGVQEAEKISYAYLSQELTREVKEELGIDVRIDPMPDFYPAPFKGPNGYDLALVTAIFVDNAIVPNGDFIWVNPEELDQQAKDFIAPKKDQGIEARGLLSGYGKRMHCMALVILMRGIRGDYAVQAEKMLTEIQSNW